MSHTQENIACPNCGHLTTLNYCAQCGQETHLHKETFWGLVMHFAGHYFHYDSKFWMTMKALWFSPGKLTIAYRQKQRMRYIPPISLYIFISAVFFLCTYLGGSQGLLHVAKTQPSHGTKEHTEVKGDFVDISLNAPSLADSNAVPDAVAVSYFDKQQQRIIKEHGNFGEFLIEKTNHNIPKLFFFMIPAMAAILKLLYIRRKDVLFIDHAIFSLHYHCFWFSIFILSLIHFPQNVLFYLFLGLLGLAAVYMTSAIHNVYKSSWVKSVLNMVSLGILYTLVLIIAIVIDLFVIVAMA